MTLSFSEFPIILCRPQLGQNIGAVARAMHNFGFSDLRLVAPRDNWPNDEALAMAAGAKALVQQAQLFKSLDAALYDVHYSFALTARQSALEKDCYAPRSAASLAYQRSTKSQKVAFVLGCEANGLLREELSYTHSIITIPTQPDYASLNLAQAALLICYEVFLCTLSSPASVQETPQEAPAYSQEQEFALQRLVALLEQRNYFRSQERKERSIQELRSLFLRAQLSSNELSKLQGLISQLFS